MLDYTDISSKAEDIKNALDSLYEMIYSQYKEEGEKYQRMIQDIKSANKCLNEVNDIADRLKYQKNLKVCGYEARKSDIVGIVKL